jgi:hypothetical protein
MRMAYMDRYRNGDRGRDGDDRDVERARPMKRDEGE